MMEQIKKEELIDMIGSAISEALKDENCLIIFFGSIVKGNFDNLSDIDVGIYCGKEIDPILYLKIEEAIENLPILREIDIVDLALVKDKYFLGKIIEEGKVWKGSEELLKDLKRLSEGLRK